MLDRWVRNILTVYPVVIVALVGNVWKHFNPNDPSANAVFMGKFVMNDIHNCTFTNTSSRVKALTHCRNYPFCANSYCRKKEPLYLP